MLEGQSESSFGFDRNIFGQKRSSCIFVNRLCLTRLFRHDFYWIRWSFLLVLVFLKPSSDSKPLISDFFSRFVHNSFFKIPVLFLGPISIQLIYSHLILVVFGFFNIVIGIKLYQANLLIH